MKRGAPQALRLKQSGSLPPLFFWIALLPLSPSAGHSNLSPNNDAEGRRKRTQVVYFSAHFLFHFGLINAEELSMARRCVNQHVTADPVPHRLQPERGLICVQRKAEGIGYLWGDMALWRGSSVGANMTCH